jgi:hypothetical protein
LLPPPKSFGRPVEIARSPSHDDAPASPQSEVAAAGPAVVVRSASLTRVTDDGLEIVIEGGRASSVTLGKVLAVAVGTVPNATPGKPGGRSLIVDLIMMWGQAGHGAHAVRFTGASLGLSRLFPGSPPRQAVGTLMARILERSGARALPDDTSVRSGAYAAFESVAAFEGAIYGAAL